MSERLVDIPVTVELRKLIKETKGKLTYNKFFEGLLASKMNLRVNSN